MLWLKILLAVLETLLGLIVILGIVVFALAIQRPKKRRPPKDDWGIRRQKIREKNNAALFALSPEDVSLETPDGLTLRGWFLPAGEPTKRLVICIHGHNCNGPDEFSLMMPFYHEKLGYHYFLPDLRGHGRSGGKYLTFGARDHKDILQWMDYFIARLGADVEIIVHGISMGAATTMLTNSANPPEQMKLAIEDCGYTSAYEVIHNTFIGLFHFPCPPVMLVAGLLMRIFAGFRLRDADCLGKMPNAKNPVLFLHGAKDTFVPTRMGITLHEACPAPKELLLIEGEGHAASYYNNSALYEETVTRFIRENMEGKNAQLP